MRATEVHRRFTAAVDALIEDIRQDRSILAAVLCGSLSHDTVWTKSDVDLVLVTIDDRKIDESDVALYAEGVNVHALLMPRAQFRASAEGSQHNSFIHSFLAKGRILYTHDPTIADMCRRLQSLGERDAIVQRLRAAVWALPSIYKAHKWLVTRGDLDYTALWILYAATPLARIEVIDAGLIADREVLPQALALNPDFFRIVYTDLLDGRKSRERVEAALAAVDGFMAARAPVVFAPVIEYLREAGEPRSCKDLEHHFAKNFDVTDVTTACEYLADQGLIEKASVPVHLTRRSNVEVQELAFYVSG